MSVAPHHGRSCIFVGLITMKHLCKHLSFIFIFLIASDFIHAQENNWKITKGWVHFSSDAPLESISAESDQLKGVLTIADNRFAFSVEISTFEGFNSALQKEHFNENYMESDQFHTANFSGKIIEKLDYTKNGTFNARAKGFLEIHGVKKERIIPVVIIINNGNYQFTSNFNVLLPDHNISVPRIVFQKISQTIQVEVKGEFGK